MSMLQSDMSWGGLLPETALARHRTIGGHASCPCKTALARHRTIGSGPISSVGVRVRYRDIRDFPAQVVVEDVGAATPVGQSHPDYLVEATWAAQGCVDEHDLDRARMWGLLHCKGCRRDYMEHAPQPLGNCGSLRNRAISSGVYFLPVA